jgi:hypothetical protein
MLERVKDSVQGVQVSAPFGKVELALEVFRDHLGTPSDAVGTAAGTVGV